MHQKTFKKTTSLRLVMAMLGSTPAVGRVSVVVLLVLVSCLLNLHESCCYVVWDFGERWTLNGDFYRVYGYYEFVMEFLNRVGCSFMS